MSSFSDLKSFDDNVVTKMQTGHLSTMKFKSNTNKQVLIKLFHSSIFLNVYYK